MNQPSPVKCKQMQSLGRTMENISCILDCGFVGSLYLGNYDSAIDYESLKKHKIQSILSVCMTKIPATISSKMKFYEHIYLEDSEKENIQKYFASTFNFIEKGRQVGNVLIHCAAGISRSATLIAAYLMQKHQVSYRDALTQLERKRWQVYPNDGFVKQLISYEKDLNLSQSTKRNDWIEKLININSPGNQNLKSHPKNESNSEYSKIRKKYLSDSKEYQLRQDSIEYALQIQRKTQFEILTKGIDLQMQRQKLLTQNTNSKKEKIHMIDEQRTETDGRKYDLTINKFHSISPYYNLQIESKQQKPNKKAFDNSSYTCTNRNYSQQVDSNSQYQSKLDNLLNQFGKKRQKNFITPD